MPNISSNACKIDARVHSSQARVTQMRASQECADARISDAGIHDARISDATRASTTRASLTRRARPWHGARVILGVRVTHSACIFGARIPLRVHAHVHTPARVDLRERPLCTRLSSENESITASAVSPLFSHDLPHVQEIVGRPHGL